MSALKLKAAALLGAAILILAACGSSAADPVGGVAAAFDIAKSGGTLKQMDLVACLTTGGAISNAFSASGFSRDALANAGINPDDLTAAWKISFDNLQTSEASRVGDQATVHVSVKVTSEVDAGNMRDLVKKQAATPGVVPPDDATIDAAILASLGGSLTQSETITKDVSVVQQNGKWVACGSEFSTAG